MEFTDKVVMITGASRGIGEAAARAFAKKGAKVVLVARGIDEISRVAGEIGENALAVPCDVSRYHEVETAVGACVDTFGRLDVLINNAGVIEPITHMAEAEPEGWARVIDINLKGVMWGMRAALPVMLDQGAGTVITTSSGAAYGPQEAWSAYCASKAGALMLTRNLDMEYRDKGIRALGLSPGTVATEMQREIKKSGINRISELNWEDHIPPEWPAEALLWMCGRQADAYLGKDVMLREDVIRKAIGVA